jgi:hypothetical protein
MTDKLNLEVTLSGERPDWLPRCECCDRQVDGLVSWLREDHVLFEANCHGAANQMTIVPNKVRDADDFNWTETVRRWSPFPIAN